MVNSEQSSIQYCESKVRYELRLHLVIPREQVAVLWIWIRTTYKWVTREQKVNMSPLPAKRDKAPVSCAASLSNKYLSLIKHQHTPKLLALCVVCFWHASANILFIQTSVSHTDSCSALQNMLKLGTSRA